MNAYIIVEGKTETIVYPEWLRHIAPELTKADGLDAVVNNNYYLFCGRGIPSIFDHIANAACDINAFNSKGGARIDYLMVCIDTEEESREYIIDRIEKSLSEKNISELSFRLEVFEQMVSMETWFLGNRRIFKANPADENLQRYISYYNVRDDNPELMGNIDEELFSTKAQFHHSYLKNIFAERQITYSKRNPGEVCKQHYLQRIIERYDETGHLASFGRWYNFVKTHLCS